MNVARFDFSTDSDIKTHADCLENLNFARQQRPEKSVSVLMDTKGPVIYTGYLRDSKPADLIAGQYLKIVNDPAIEGDNTKISVTYKQLPTTVKIGDAVYIDNGGLTCEVTETHDDHIVVSIKNNYTITDRMKMNLPGAQIEMPTITEQD
jgi:pyruvate kinase